MGRIAHLKRRCHSINVEETKLQMDSRAVCDLGLADKQLHLNMLNKTTVCPDDHKMLEFGNFTISVPIIFKCCKFNLSYHQLHQDGGLVKLPVF